MLHRYNKYKIMKKKCVKYSLSEIDAESKKAARGCGFSWGHAEEIGKAVRWLAAHKLPGVMLLADYLTQRDQDVARYQQLIEADQRIQSGSDNGILCPLLTGSYICDSGIESVKKTVRFNSLAYPLLLLPYVARLTLDSENALLFRWNSVSFYCDAGKLMWIDKGSVTSPVAGNVICESTPSLSKGKLPGNKGQSIDEQSWQKLTTLSHRIYVPASEASRKGAGPS